MTDQRFGDTGIDAIHTHVIAVVGGPAKCKLTQIAGADHKAAVFIGVIHQLQRSHAGLAVFKGDIIGFGVLPDVGKMALNRGGNVDFLKADIQRFAENFGVGAGAFAGAKAGHGDCHNIPGITPQNVAGPHGNQKRKAGIQPPGDSHHRAAGVGMLYPFGKAFRLNAQNQFAAFGAGGIVPGHKGRGGNLAGQRHFHRLKVKGNSGIAFGVRLKSGVARPLLNHAPKIQLCHGAAILKRTCLSQQGTVLGNEIMGGKGHIGCAFPMACVGVKVSAEQAGTLATDQVAAVGGFSHRLIAGREIGDHGGPCQRMGAAGRDGRPKILADLDPQDEFRHLTAGKQQIGAKQCLLAGQLHGGCLGGAGKEMPLLIELAVIGKVRFGHKAKELAVTDNGGTVVQFAAAAHRQPHDSDQIQPAACRENLRKTLFRSADQGFLQKKIAAGIAGQTEFRQTEKLGVPRGVLPHRLDDFLCVIGHIGHPETGRSCGGTKKAIFHCHHPFHSV